MNPEEEAQEENAVSEKDESEKRSRHPAKEISVKPPDQKEAPQPGTAGEDEQKEQKTQELIPQERMISAIWWMR